MSRRPAENSGEGSAEACQHMERSTQSPDREPSSARSTHDWNGLPNSPSHAADCCCCCEPRTARGPRDWNGRCQIRLHTLRTAVAAASRGRLAVRAIGTDVAKFAFIRCGTAVAAANRDGSRSAFRASRQPGRFKIHPRTPDSHRSCVAVAGCHTFWTVSICHFTNLN